MVRFRFSRGSCEVYVTADCVSVGEVIHRSLLLLLLWERGRNGKYWQLEARLVLRMKNERAGG